MISQKRMKYIVIPNPLIINNMIVMTILIANSAWSILFLFLKFIFFDWIRKKNIPINITNINEYNKIKNISFEITDERLLNETGGIVQGMSGSPIVQNDKLCGAVTHVIIDNVKTGYGLFITTMLEESERWLIHNKMCIFL